MMTIRSKKLTILIKISGVTSFYHQILFLAIQHVLKIQPFLLKWLIQPFRFGLGQYNVSNTDRKLTFPVKMRGIPRPYYQLFVRYENSIKQPFLAKLIGKFSHFYEEPVNMMTKRSKKLTILIKISGVISFHQQMLFEAIKHVLKIQPFLQKWLIQPFWFGIAPYNVSNTDRKSTFLVKIRGLLRSYD